MCWMSDDTLLSWSPLASVTFFAFEGYPATAISDSYIADSRFDKKKTKISLDIAADHSGHCKLIFSKWLLEGAINFFIDNTPTVCSINWSSECHMIEFTYSQGTHTVEIIGEFANPCVPDFPDINRDGKIDILPIATVAKDYGKTV